MRCFACRPPGLAFLLLSSFLATSARGAPAADPIVAASPPEVLYNGSFLGPRVELGLTTGIFGSEQSGPGLALAVGGRLATILQILDLHLGYRAHFATLAGEALSQHGVLLDLRLHPFFVRHVDNSLRGYLLGGVHVLAGVGAVWSRTEDLGGDVRPAYALGLGFDVPLTQVDRSWGLWIGFGWRMMFTRAAWPGLRRDIDYQVIGVSLELRHHALDF